MKNKQLHRLLALVLSLTMLCGLLTVGAAAANACAITVSSVAQAAKPGEKITLSADISNNTGFTNFEVAIDYDHDKLQLDSVNTSREVQVGEDAVTVYYLCGSMSATNVAWKYAQDTSKTYGYINSAAANATTKNGTLFTMTFTVKSGVTAGSTSVNLINIKFNKLGDDSKENPVNPSIIAGTVALTNADCAHEYTAAQNSDHSVTYTCAKCADSYTIDGLPFTITAGDTSIVSTNTQDVAKDESGAYPVYTVTVPAGTSSVGYSNEDLVLVGAAASAAKTAVIAVAAEANGTPNTIQVKSPADKNAASYTMYAITFAYSTSAYTVAAQPEKTSVSIGETFAVDVKVSGAAYNQTDIQLNYDKELFTFNRPASDNTVTEPTAGTIRIQQTGVSKADGSVAKSLSFTAKSVTQTTTGTFSLPSAKVGTGSQAMTGDAYEAKVKTSATVSVVPQFAVTFYDRGNNQIKAIPVVYNGKVEASAIPAAPAIENYDFAGWVSEGTTYSAQEIAERAVTGAVSYTAAYTAKSFDVTLDTGLTGNTQKATYGVDFTGAITGFDGSNYDYEVIAMVGTKSVKATVNENGSYSIAGAAITDNMRISVSRMIKGVTIELKEDYVSGVTLVLVTGNASNYSYDGNSMFKTPAYGEKAFAYLVNGTVTQEQVKSKLNTASETAKTIAAGTKDVNNTGKIDINDAQAVWNCYNASTEYALERYMELYFRADVDGSRVVDVTDLNTVLMAIQ